MNELTIFKSETFGEIRTLEINDEPWFVGKDVATVLGYAKPLNAIATHIDEDDSLKQGLIDGMGRTQETILINESGLYSLVLSSKLETAKEFKRWITHEVIPAIRKHGMYATERLLDNPDLAIAAFTALKEEREKNKVLAAKNAELAPKALFAEAVSGSDTSILIGDLAKILTQNGMKIGQNRLFERLRNEGYLIKRKGDSRNLPTQEAMEMGLFEIKERVHMRPDGTPKIDRTTVVTGKGQVYFINKYIGKKQ